MDVITIFLGICSTSWSSIKYLILEIIKVLMFALLNLKKYTTDGFLENLVAGSPGRGCTGLCQTKFSGCEIIR